MSDRDWLDNVRLTVRYCRRAIWHGGSLIVAVRSAIRVLVPRLCIYIYIYVCLWFTAQVRMCELVTTRAARWHAHLKLVEEA